MLSIKCTKCRMYLLPMVLQWLRVPASIHLLPIWRLQRRACDYAVKELKKGEFVIVIIQEKSAVENGYLIMKDDQLTKGQFVRPKGAEVKKGEKAMAAGTYSITGSFGISCRYRLRKEVPVLRHLL
jgi:hypothetical protein